MAKLIDLTGQRFGRLVVSRRAQGKPGLTKWLCHCDCGKPAEIRACHLRSGAIRSCGCLIGESATKRFRKHGRSGTPEYRAWAMAHYRCYNPKSIEFDNYGGRGIGVCQRWHGESGFLNFLADVGTRPDESLSIDRSDNNFGYWCGKAECSECGPRGNEPNCRWTTVAVQQSNRRITKRFEFLGHTKPLSEWSKITGIPHSKLAYRHRRGYDSDKMFVGATVGGWQRSLPPA